MADIFNDRLVDPLLMREGGEKYTDNPADAGGPTRWGVTAGKLGEFRRLGRDATPAEVQNLQRDEAVRLYRQEFWMNPGFDNLATLSEAVAEKMFDCGVNLGPTIPGTWLQRVLNALNHGGHDWADLPVTGKVGPLTCAAFRALVAARGQTQAEQVVLGGIRSFQYVRYVELCEKREPNEEFAWGWLKRALGL